MIAKVTTHFFEDENNEDGYSELPAIQTVGCDCCASYIKLSYDESDENQILQHAKKTKEILQEILFFYGMTWEEL